MGIHQQRTRVFQALYIFGFNTSKKNLFNKNEIAQNFLLSKGSSEFALSLFHCAVDNLKQIDTLIKQDLPVGSDKLSYRNLPRVMRAILRLAFAELFFFPKETPRALVIDEAVILAKTYAEENAYKLINAVLDKHMHEQLKEGKGSQV